MRGDDSARRRASRRRAVLTGRSGSGATDGCRVDGLLPEAADAVGAARRLRDECDDALRDVVGRAFERSNLNS